MERKDKLAYYVVMGMIAVGVCFYPEVFDCAAFKYSLFTQPQLSKSKTSSELEIMTDFCDFTCRSLEDELIEHQLCLSACQRSSKLENYFIFGILILGLIVLATSILYSANPALAASIRSNIKYLYIRVWNLMTNTKADAIILNSRPSKSSVYSKNEIQSEFDCDESTICESRIHDINDTNHPEQFENEFVRMMDALDDDFANPRMINYNKAAGYSLIA